MTFVLGLSDFLSEVLVDVLAPLAVPLTNPSFPGLAFEGSLNSVFVILGAILPPSIDPVLDPPLREPLYTPFGLFVVTRILLA